MMNRKNFLQKTIFGALGFASASAHLRVSKKDNSRSTYHQLMQQVGFNHLPIKENRTVKSVLHKANTRGHANHGWLNTNHTFSFANYYNPERMHFGVLRVLNDDIVAPAKGFSRHPHDNMEIISIPLKGDLQHKDSMGNTANIREGDIQAMSAGTGIYHSEYNKNSDREVQFLQIWLFPKKKDVTPRYDQFTLSIDDERNTLKQVLSPSKNDDGVWIHQDAWFYIGSLEPGFQHTHKVKRPENGLYTFVLEGAVTVNQQSLEKRDGYGVWDTESIEITTDESTARILVMDVPMKLPD